MLRFANFNATSTNPRAVIGCNSNQLPQFSRNFDQISAKDREKHFMQHIGKLSIDKDFDTAKH